MQDLIDAIKPFGAKLRIVYGTESHECNQYDVLSMMSLYDDIRIIKTVETEELLPGLNILYQSKPWILTVLRNCYR